MAVMTHHKEFSNETSKLGFFGIALQMVVIEQVGGITEIKLKYT